jgi:hypothetical protein
MTNACVRHAERLLSKVRAFTPHSHIAFTAPARSALTCLPPLAPTPLRPCALSPLHPPFSWSCGARHSIPSSASLPVRCSLAPSPMCSSAPEQPTNRCAAHL